jgi:hypothetical protein
MCTYLLISDHKVGLATRCHDVCEVADSDTDSFELLRLPNTFDYEVHSAPYSSKRTERLL